ncbi:hypothetical protein K445DRAFT_316394 [Daldinia sp. EC12]|nr:hypothetical protein K445DRAFT_316394 [Daldinia sp. EC12]
MSTPRLLLPRSQRLLSGLRPHQHQPSSHPRRSFISLPPKTISTERRLPYDHQRLYDIIADVDSYVRFLPFCKLSRVTKWTDPVPHPTSTSTSTTNSASSSTSSSPSSPPPRRWPLEADLTTGWAGIEETYTSRLFCIPSLGIVEAVSGDARSEIPLSELQKHGLVDSPTSSSSSNSGSGVFKSLVTRWTVLPADDALRADRFQHPWSDVRLVVKYDFANPLYAALTDAVKDKVVSAMIDAFVQRAESVLKDTRNDPGAAAAR